LREQLKLLEQLQTVDAELNEVKQALTVLPAKLESLREDVDRVESLLEKEHHQLDDAQSYRAELEQTIKAQTDQLNKAKAKLTQIRTSKEYMATQRELEVTRRSTLEREDELLKLMQAIEESEGKIAVHEEDLGALKDHVAEEAAETESKLAELGKKANTMQAQRDTMTDGVSASLLRRYDVIQRRTGNAVVAARHGVCTGCNMQLLPQLFRILQAGKTVECCPSCQRIVYFEVEDEGDE